MSQPALTTPLQPGERVHAYLEQEFLSGGVEGTRLPTIRAMAKHLNVSSPTVQSVVQKFVSEGQLEAVQGRGIFVKGVRPKARKTPLVVASNLMVFDPGQGPNWSETIYMGALRMASRMNQGMTFMPLSDSGAVHSREASQPSQEKIHEQLLLRMDQIDMLMLFRVDECQKIRSAYEEAGKPVVDINPISAVSTTNFVSADFFGGSERVGKAFYQTGRRNLLFVGPYTDPRPSMRLYLMGLMSGVRWGIDPDVQVRILQALAFDRIEERLHRLLDKVGTPFDGIFCSGDLLGLQCLEVLKARGVAVPDQASIVTGAGTDLTLGASGLPKVTSVVQPMAEIGANAIRVLAHRLENQCAAVPGIYLPTGIRIGETTRPEENALLTRDVEPAIPKG
ncbi:MAG TPA: LacI family DNA-binding transcriptional regulator [Chthoniobacteraceae bacterium]|nr:LacI family DNA-binding transcriptional regulator [Chthoniobacteraceae bacterium]